VRRPFRLPGLPITSNGSEATRIELPLGADRVDHGERPSARVGQSDVGMSGTVWIMGGLASAAFGGVGLVFRKMYSDWAERFGLPPLDYTGRFGKAYERAQVIGCGTFVVYGVALVVLGTIRVLMGLL
jgi:hypothetical protein